MQNLYSVSQDNIAPYSLIAKKCVWTLFTTCVIKCAQQNQTLKTVCLRLSIMYSAKEDEKLHIAASIVTMRTAGLTLEQILAVMMAKR
jgi:hypothetical protein